MTQTSGDTRRPKKLATDRDAFDETPELRFEGAQAYGRIPTAGAATTAGEVRAQLAGSHFESAAHVAVLDNDRRLLGLARIEDVLAATSTVAMSVSRRSPRGWRRTRRDRSPARRHP